MSNSVYAKPVAPRIILRPILATLLLHGLMIYLMTVNWASSDREVTRVKPAPKFINARLVDISEFQPSKPVAKPEKKPPPKKPAVKKVAKKTPAAAKPAPKKPAVKKVAVKKPEKTATPKPEAKPQPKITHEELAAIARAELAETVAAQEQSSATATADEMAASFAALIRQTVVSYWSRPPSARNGMEAELSIQLIPTGEIVSVRVIRSSGNTAFDRSAMNAVQKAGVFPELQQLPNREFEKNFRRFRLLFRPEDLRY